jgi:Uma2 family endonuclease
MSAIEKIIPYYTYEDYKHWEGQWELIDGLPFAMAPSPIYNHQLIASNLLALFWNALENCAGCKVLQPLDYIVKNDTVLQPDMMVVCKEVTKDFIEFPPSLVCEVISPSTALKDRHTKFNIYQSQKVRYYIIISPATEDVEIYKLDEAGAYMLTEKGRDIKYSFSLEDCEAKIDFQRIWP